ncbi:MAG: hydrogenase subunit MbhD domain-containing protein [Acidobacteriota bacterium]
MGSILEYFVLFLVFLMIVLALFAVRTKALLAAVIASGFISLVASIVYLYLKAPDVAMTEAAIGAGLTTIIFVVTVRKTKGREK